MQNVVGGSRPDDATGQGSRRRPQQGGSQGTIGGSGSSGGSGSRAPGAAGQAWQANVAPQGLSMHATPFSAMAAMLDDCMLRAVQSGPTCASWDVRSDPRGGGPLLVFEHDCNGMCPEELYAMLGLESAAEAGGSGAAAASGRASALMHAVLRLGSSATVLTKRLSAGKVLPSVGLGVIVFDPGPPAGARSGVLYCNPDQSLQDGAGGAAAPGDFHPAFARGGYASWDDVQQELDTMQPQGTKIAVRGLWARQEGGTELDVVSDPNDIRSHKGDALADLLPLERKDVGVQRCMVHRYSFRAYAAILYRHWPQGFLLTIRGLPVQIQDIRAWMKGCVSEEYRPRGVKDEVDEHGFQMQHVVHVHVGFLIDVPRTSMQGFCLYHKNRLIKPFWRVYSSSTVGRGVVGYLEADFVAPTPDWQDFERSHAFLKLEAFLKRCVPAYWKKHAATGGYLGGPSGHPASTAAPSRPLPLGPSQQMLPLGATGRPLTTPFSGVPPQLALGAQQAGSMPPQQQQAGVGHQRPGAGGLSQVHIRPGGQPQPGVPDQQWGPGFQLSGWGSMSPGSLTPPSTSRGPAQGLFGQMGSGVEQAGLLPHSAGLVVAGPGAGHGMVPQQITAAMAQGFLGGGAYGRSRLGGGPLMPPTSAGLPYGMQALLQPFSSGQGGPASLGDAPGRGGPGLPLPGGGGGPGTQPIHQLQKLLASAPQGVVQQLQQGMDSASAFFPVSQQVAGSTQQQQQGGAPQAGQGMEWELPGGAGPTNSLDMQLPGRQASGGLSLSMSLDAMAQQMVQQAQHAQQQPAAEQAPAADLAHALATLATQPRQLSQVLAMLGQEVQQAEQAGLPSSANLRQMQSLLSKLVSSGSDSPQSRAVPERSVSRTASMPYVHPSKTPAVAVPAQPTRFSAPGQLAQQEGSMGGSGGGGSGPAAPPQAVPRLADPPSVEPPPGGLGKTSGTAEGAAAEPQRSHARDAGRPTLGVASVPAAELVVKSEKPSFQTPQVPSRGDAKPPSDVRAPAAVANLASRLEGDIAAFVRRVVLPGPQQEEGMQLARSVKAAVEQLAELQQGGKGGRDSPSSSSKSPAESPTNPGPKRQRT